MFYFVVFETCLCTFLAYFNKEEQSYESVACASLQENAGVIRMMVTDQQSVIIVHTCSLHSLRLASIESVQQLAALLHLLHEGEKKT